MFVALGVSEKLGNLLRVLNRLAEKKKKLSFAVVEDWP